jgi:predicted regulator of Ras-like GTPase activity (Roadblock/LC7/MglB family)
MALVGDLKDLALVDIIQINCIGRNTARLTVHYPNGDGVFYFQDGEVVDARFGNLTGTDAVYHALRYNEGSFRIDTGIAAPTRTIYEQWANILMEGMRILDEERAGIIPASPGPGFNQPSPSMPTPAMGTPTGGIVRAINPYQALVNDLTKIKGVEGAIVTMPDGTLQAHSNIKSPEKVGMLVAFLVHGGKQASAPSRAGDLRRISVISNQRKMIVFDQEEFLAAIDCAATVRYETISPYLDRAFRKVQMRRSPGSGGSVLGSPPLSGQLV